LVLYGKLCHTTPPFFCCCFNIRSQNKEQIIIHNSCQTETKQEQEFNVNEYTLFVCATCCIGGISCWVYLSTVEILFKSALRRGRREEEDVSRSHATREIPANVAHTKNWMPNSEGQLVFQQQFIPENFTAVIVFVHGYGDHSHHMTLQIILDFCAKGFAILAMDAIGHGLSDGLHGHCESLDDVVRDYHAYIVSQRQRSIFQHKKLFLYGQSMGGAIAFNLCTKWKSSHIDGCILCAPMVNIAENMLPPKIIINAANFIAKWIPLAPITPTPNVADGCFKLQSKLLESLECNLNYRQKPRVVTALALQAATKDVSARLHEMQHPLLLLHGAADTVTCPDHTKLLFQKCSSVDKSLHIYPDAMHSLMAGETDEQIKAIREDISLWILKRS
jgi:caffeoylshikimate esterase